MNCKTCSKSFNLINRVPMLLLCCQETICMDCSQKLTGDPQQQTFNCPITYCGESNSQSGLKINKAIQTFLKGSLDIYCDEHPREPAEMYSQTQEKLVCMECITQNQEVINVTKKVTKQILTDYHDTILQKLAAEHKRIGNLIESIENYQKNLTEFKASQYIKIIRNAQQILIPRMETIQAKVDISSFFKFFEIQELITSQTIHSLDSKIIQQSDHQFIRQCLPHSTIKLELLYRATRDTFSASAFHSKCDNQGATLCVVKSEHQRIFGGYSSVSWTSSKGFKADEKAFIFSVTDRRKFEQYQQFNKAIGDDKGCVSFGGGCDFSICDNSDEIKESYSNLGYTYALPEGIKYNTVLSKKYLAGSHQFKVIDYEVFKVIFI